MLLGILWGSHVPARAGGGPENVVLVVNARSWASLTLANHYARLRQIPPAMIHYVDLDVAPESMPVEAFRQQVLTPVLTQLARQGLLDQVDCLTYSSDFPYAIDCRADVGERTLPPTAAPTASLTGLTCLWQMTLAKDVNYLALNSNRYFRRALQGNTEIPTLGFRGWYGWGPTGEIVEAGGPRVLLSTMLAATSGRGTSLDESLAYLRAASQADGTRPDGTFYFTETADVRAETRRAFVEPAREALRTLGLKSEIVSQVLPSKREDVLGLTMGAPDFDWRRAASRFLPGALADNLTSTGGVLRHASNQTCCTEFLRGGAAGTSGTVVEPYAIAEKFPTPFLHVHYARGCTLAEAYYQSVSGPYQLLVLGDPLCRPWATIPRVELSGVSPGAKLKGTVELRPLVAKEGPAVDRFELFVDGVRRAHCAGGESMLLDTRQWGDGDHELRIVGFEQTEIESQGRHVLRVTVANDDREVQLSRAASGKVVWGQTVDVSLASVGAAEISLVQGARTLGSVTGESGNLSLDSRILGLGPITLVAIARSGPDGRSLVYSPPLTIEIAAPPLRKAQGDIATVRGLWLVPEGAKGQAIHDLRKNQWLEQAGVRSDQAFRLRAVFDAEVDGLAQFQLRFVGDLRMSIDGEAVFRATSKRSNSQWYVPLALARGTHELEIFTQPQGKPRLDLRYGQRGTAPLDGELFRHRAERQE